MRFTKVNGSEDGDGRDFNLFMTPMNTFVNKARKKGMGL